MRSCLVTLCSFYRIAFVLVLSSLLSAWTCSGMFTSCFGLTQQPQLTTLSPGIISAESISDLLIVEGSGFVSTSEILWNGNALQTRFIDSQHLQATITQQTFASFGGSAGSSVLISVMSPEAATVEGCAAGESSATLALVIN